MIRLGFEQQKSLQKIRLRFRQWRTLTTESMLRERVVDSLIFAFVEC